MKNLTIVLVFLASCSTTTLVTSQTDLPSSHPPEITPLNLSEYNWKILTNQDLSNFLDSAKKTGSHIVLYTLDDKNYLILDGDLLELERYIQEQDQVISFYRQLEDDRNSRQNQKQK